MRSRSYKFTSKVVPPTAEPVPPATWNRGIPTFCGPAAVPPIGIAHFRTQSIVRFIAAPDMESW